MAQHFHKIRADSLDEAYSEMRRTLGEDAVVLRTAEVKEGRFLGLLGRKRVELTVAVPDKARHPRKPSPVEKRYAQTADGTLPGSPRPQGRSAKHIARFREVAEGKGLSEGASRAARGRSSAGSAQTAPLEAPVIPFRAVARPAETDTLRREMREVRQTLDVLIAESPGTIIPYDAAPYYRAFLEQGMARKLAASLITRLATEADPQTLRDRDAAMRRLKALIQRRITATGGITLTPGKCRVVALVGTTGVGKTTNLAKLATHFAVREQARVAFVTADTYRVAAPDQLKVYADIIGLPMAIVDDAKEMAAVTRRLRDHDLILIDTAGGSPFNVRHLQELRGVLGAARPDEVILVLSAGSQLDDLRFAVENLRCLHPTSLMFSKLDETRQFGVLFTTLVETRIPVSYLSVGQDVPEDIEIAGPELIAELVVEGKLRRGRSSA